MGPMQVAVVTPAESNPHLGYAPSDALDNAVRRQATRAWSELVTGS